MPSPRLDLNLLQVFEAVYECRHITRAAERLALTQSAVSNALGRLRHQWGDPLFVRTPQGMQPTARAEEIAPTLLDALARIRQTLAPQQAFDPAQSQRHFRVCMTEVGQWVMGQDLLKLLSAGGPGLSLEIVSPPSRASRDQAMSDGDIDLAIGYLEAFDGPFRTRTLFHEDCVCVGHASIGETLTLTDYLAWPHLVYTPPGSGHAQREQVIDTHLASMGLARQVALRTPHFLGLDPLLAESPRLATLPRRLAQACAQHQALRVWPLPLDVPGFEVCQLWHMRQQDDAGNRWLREQVATTWQATA